MDELTEQRAMTDDDFYVFCRHKSNYKFEREPDGRIIIISRSGGKTGILNAKLTCEVSLWREQTNLGEVFDSSTAFTLPDGSTPVRRTCPG